MSYSKNSFLIASRRIGMVEFMGWSGGGSSADLIGLLRGVLLIKLG